MIQKLNAIVVRKPAGACKVPKSRRRLHRCDHAHIETKRIAQEHIRRPPHVLSPWRIGGIDHIWGATATTAGLIHMLALERPSSEKTLPYPAIAALSFATCSPFSRPQRVRLSSPFSPLSTTSTTMASPRPNGPSTTRRYRHCRQTIRCLNPCTTTRAERRWQKRPRILCRSTPTRGATFNAIRDHSTSPAMIFRYTRWHTFLSSLACIQHNSNSSSNS